MRSQKCGCSTTRQRQRWQPVAANDTLDGRHDEPDDHSACKIALDIKTVLWWLNQSASSVHDAPRGSSQTRVRHDAVCCVLRRKKAVMRAYSG